MVCPARWQCRCVICVGDHRMVAEDGADAACAMRSFSLGCLLIPSTRIALNAPPIRRVLQASRNEDAGECRRSRAGFFHWRCGYEAIGWAIELERCTGNSYWFIRVIYTLELIISFPRASFAKCYGHPSCLPCRPINI